MIHNVDPQLNQWDVGRRVNVSDTNATHIHFANQGDSKAVKIDIEAGSAKIPDYLLQTGKTVIAYAVLNGVTLESKSFPVRKRPRPEDYVYEDDQRNYIYELITNAEDAVVNANLATQNANEAAEKALQAAESWVMIGTASGESIAIDDAIKQYFAGFRIFGKTTQDGTPTPDAPVDLVSVGDSGSITVNVAGENDAQSMTIATPNGLPGIPVASGGNYTDATGQQWICDEIDLARGVYVQRVKKKRVSSALNWAYSTGTSRFHALDSDYTSGDTWGILDILCTHFVANHDGTLANLEVTYINDSAFGFAYRYDALNGDVAAWKTFLDENEVHIVAELRNHIETPLSAEELAAYASLHSYKDLTTVSNDASAHMELEYFMDAKKYIDSVVPAPARLSSVTLRASAWAGSNSLYSQVVTIDGTTEYSKVDLLPSVEQLAIFHNKDVAFVTENEDGVVTVYAIGEKPTNDYTMQVSITEVKV